MPCGAQPTPRPQLLHEIQGLEIPHTNFQVRMNHCLRVCERIMAQQIKSSELGEFEAGVDGIVLFAPRIETGRIASQQGIFARREPPPEAIAAASHEGGESPHPQPHEDADRLTD